MKYKIKNTYEVSKTQEISVDWDGYNFLIIYGKHINGWFIAIPNWNCCTEAGQPTNDSYNTEKLSKVIDIENAPSVIAKAVREHWESGNVDLKTLEDLENMKKEACIPYGTQYDYFFAALQDLYIAKLDGLSRIKAELEQWDDEAKEVIAEKLIDIISESGIMEFDKNEILKLM